MGNSVRNNIFSEYMSGYGDPNVGFKISQVIEGDESDPYRFRGHLSGSHDKLRISQKAGIILRKTNKGETKRWFYDEKEGCRWTEMDLWIM